MIQVQHWHTCDRVLITDEEHHGSVQLDILKDCTAKENLRSDALVWALCVDEPYRGRGVGAALLGRAETEAAKRGCESVSLEWDRRDSKEWTLQWYMRQGYDEKEFGHYGSLLVKQLK